MSTVFHRVLEAEPAVPSLLRRAFRRWLGELCWPAEETDDLIIALDEAVANVIDHAYQGENSRDHRTVDVRAERMTSPDGDRVLIEVTDSGGWRPIPADPGYRGRGLLMMRAVTDSLAIDPSPAGTRITMLGRPVPPSARGTGEHGQRRDRTRGPAPVRSNPELAQRISHAEAVRPDGRRFPCSHPSHR